MKDKHELRIIDESIQAYENTIKFLRRQIVDLHRKKLDVPEECPACFTYKFKIAQNKKKQVKEIVCEACGCTPCDCDYGNNEVNIWEYWGEI